MVSIDTFASIGATIAFREKTNDVIVEWNLGYFSNVADCKSVGVLKWLGEMCGPKIS